MKRLFRVGVGVAWVSAGGVAAAADPVGVADPAFVDLSAVRQAGAPAPVAAPPADAPPAFPTTPTVIAPYASPLPTQIGGFPEPEPAPVAAPGGCGPTGCRPRGDVKERLKAWFCYTPGPAVLPQWNPEPGHPPLMAYFPCKPFGGVGCGAKADAAPGTLFTDPGAPLAAYRGSVRFAPTPLAGVAPPPSPPVAPTESAAPKTDAERKRDEKKDDENGEKKEKRPAEMLYQAPPLPAVPTVPAVRTPAVVPGVPATMPRPAAPAAYPEGRVSQRPGRGAGLIDAIGSAFSRTRSEPADVPALPAPWAAPATTTPQPVSVNPPAAPAQPLPVARGAAPTDPKDEVVRAGGPTTGGGIQRVNHAVPATVAAGCDGGNCDGGCDDGRGGLFPCKAPHGGNVRCLGHGNLDGYRFANAVVIPCPPLKPLAVKTCFGFRPVCSTNPGFGGNCAGAEADPVGFPAPLPPVAEGTPVSLPPVPEASVYQPLTSP